MHAQQEWKRLERRVEDLRKKYPRGTKCTFYLERPAWGNSTGTIEEFSVWSDLTIRVTVHGYPKPIPVDWVRVNGQVL